jgi:hypothetical protein
MAYGTDRDRDRQCAGKIAYDFWPDIEAAVRRLRKLGRNRARAYRCGYCDRLHISSGFGVAMQSKVNHRATKPRDREVAG